MSRSLLIKATVVLVAMVMLRELPVLATAYGARSPDCQYAMSPA